MSSKSIPKKTEENIETEEQDSSSKILNDDKEINGVSLDAGSNKNKTLIESSPDETFSNGTGKVLIERSPEETFSHESGKVLKESSPDETHSHGTEKELTESSLVEILSLKMAKSDKDIKLVDEEEKEEGKDKGKDKQKEKDSVLVPKTKSIDNKDIMIVERALSRFGDLHEDLIGDFDSHSAHSVVEPSSEVLSKNASDTLQNPESREERKTSKTTSEHVPEAEENEIVLIEKEDSQKLREIPEDDIIEIVEEYEEKEGDHFIIKTRIHRVNRNDYSAVSGNEDVFNLYEEYEVEEVDENGETRIVTKKALVSRFLEKLSKCEVEEEDENGKLITVTRKCKTLVPLDRISGQYSYEDVIEHYMVKVITEDGEEAMIKQTRVVRKKTHAPETNEQSNVPTILGVNVVDNEPKEEKYEDKKEGQWKEKEYTKAVTTYEQEQDITAETIIKKHKMKGKHARKRIPIYDEEGREIIQSDDEIGSEDTTLEEDSSEENESLEDSDVTTGATLTESELLRIEEEEATKAEMYQKLQKLQKEHKLLVKRNQSLTNKVIKFLRDKKMFNTLSSVKDVKEDPAMDEKFVNKLIQFYNMNTELAEAKVRVNQEWEAQREVNEELTDQRRQLIEELIARNKEVAANLISKKTGHSCPSDKKVEDLMTGREQVFNQLSDWRLAYIRLGSHIKSKHAERRGDLNSALQLPDYEKLNSLQEHLVDNIICRDIEIQETQQKFRREDDDLNTIKERCDQYDSDILNEIQRLETITSKLNEKKAALTQLKMKKHMLENKTFQMKQKTGLLAYPRLLVDYQEKQYQLGIISAEIEKLKEDYLKGKRRIEKLKNRLNRKNVPTSSETLSI